MKKVKFQAILKEVTKWGTISHFVPYESACFSYSYAFFCRTMNMDTVAKIPLGLKLPCTDINIKQVLLFPEFQVNLGLLIIFYKWCSM